MERHPQKRGTPPGAPRIVLPTEGGTPPASTPPVSPSGKEERSPASPGKRRRSPSAPEKKPRRAPSTGKQTPPAPVRAAVPSGEAAPRPPRREKRTAGPAADQAAHLRNVLRTGTEQDLRRAIARLLRQGPARTAKVVRNMGQLRDRRLVERTVAQIAEDRDRAFAVSGQLRSRGMYDCSVAVLLCAVERRPAELPGIVKQLRREGREKDARRLLSAAEWLPAGTRVALAEALGAAGLRREAEGVRTVPAVARREEPPPSYEKSAHILKYTSHSAEAERALHRIRHRRRERRRREEAERVRAARSGGSWFTALLRLLAPLFGRRP
ncbi:hypothetical protein [Streptomyces sennicomposti]